MRILSQDGRIDVPYKQCGFIVFFNELFSGNWDINANIGGNKPYKMAEYSTEAKARKAMEMLRVSFENYDWIKSTGNSEELKQVARMFNRDEFKKMTSSYFQFPSDDEVEV
mgnify:CR=1 FL=1